MGLLCRVRVAYLSHARVLMIKQVNIPMIVAVQYICRISTHKANRYKMFMQSFFSFTAGLSYHIHNLFDLPTTIRQTVVCKALR